MISLPQLSLRGVARTYGERDEWFALRDANLDIQEGEFVAIVGPSGSGKSTLLNILGLLDDRWAGSYLIDGVDVRALTRSDRDQLRAQLFGFIFQSSHANPYESAVRNAALGLAIQGAPLQEQSLAVQRSLAMVGLSAKAGSLARVLSGGERQRLAIARAISTRPRILLADEPTGNLDSTSAGLVMTIFDELNASGTTVIIVTHDHDVAAHASRVIHVKDGVASGVVQPPTDATNERSTGPYELKDIGARSQRRLVRLGFERVTRAINNVTSRPLRSVALVAAFGIAIAGMIAASGVGASASQQIADRLTAAARDELRITTPVDQPVEERREWIRTVESLPFVLGVGEVGAVDANIARTARSGFSGDEESFAGATIAATAKALDLMDIETRPQAAAAALDTQGNVALVGASVAESLGVVPDSYGHEIWVAGRPYTVVGIVSSSSRTDSLLNAVIVPLGGGELTPVLQLLVRTEPGYPAAVADAIPLAIDPGAPARVAVSTVGDLRNLRVGVSTDLSGLLASLAAALLILAVLSAASAMFLSVQSRLQELALSRALGLSRLGTGIVFIFEGAIIGLAGALVGIAGGLTVAVAVAALRGWTAVVPWDLLAVAPLVGLLAGALSAAVPAFRAARVDPADAIR